MIPSVMQHDLIYLLVSGFVAAFVCGLVAKKLKLPTIVGYLLAGILIGPHTPGYVADVKLAQQLAEVGVMLLMFGVGMHFSMRDLLRVRMIALPGAVTQMVVATVIGTIIMMGLGYAAHESFIFGFSLSVASTIVLLRALEQRGESKTDTGKIAVGWLIIEDVAMVLAVILLPVYADILQHDNVSAAALVETLVTALFKLGGFILLMMVVGRRFLPWLFVTIAKTKSHELINLATLAVALGFAYLAYAVFNASFALGAFLAGMVLNESDIGRKSAEKTLPLRDAFAVLFFVSVGMLFDPSVLWLKPLEVFITLFIIIVIKSAAALAILHIFRQERVMRYTIAISLAQIGEFSFILGGMAVAKGVMNPELYSFILAGALLSIALNSFLFHGLNRWAAQQKPNTLPV